VLGTLGSVQCKVAFSPRDGTGRRGRRKTLGFCLLFLEDQPSVLVGGKKKRLLTRTHLLRAQLAEEPVKHALELVATLGHGRVGLVIGTAVLEDLAHIVDVLFGGRVGAPVDLVLDRAKVHRLLHNGNVVGVHVGVHRQREPRAFGLSTELNEDARN